MGLTTDEGPALETLEERLAAILPEEYQESYDEVKPDAMRSAGLKYDRDGRVAWNEIWGSFCDLAMAGGPPHKGALLEAGRAADVHAQPDRYREVVDEICRGITMVTDLPAAAEAVPGWVRVSCVTESMADWLLRAIVVENVAVRADGAALDLPAAPHFRLEREIKNVVTVIAKTCHYYGGHMSREQRRAVAGLFAAMAQESPLVTPASSSDPDSDARQSSLAAAIGDSVGRATGLRLAPRRSGGWLGFECPSVRAAIWMMRMLVVSNVLARREETVLFVPVNPAIDPAGDLVARALTRVHRFAAARGMM